ncbi:SAM-dependent methyltransferase [Streptosporangium lutulentum]|uniref:S-adenosyl methyltransferase n=1 Tax=Streptosporangium lutulentum TaxID=1461250 RepID=A0ABT9QUM9_9ACTN|nr:SAM-dependent methyltransferase [Streptosporangium lutulentum]MDP9850467.1 hypothetical protein [Streptosporangium lutulentum]
MSSAPWSASDTSGPSRGGLYNYLLGNESYYKEVDKEAAEWVVASGPALKRHMVEVAHANREFIARVVRYMVKECGTLQFLDVGSGQIGDVSVHRVAQAAAREVGLEGIRVVYADNDPNVFASAKIEFASDKNTIFIVGNPLAPKNILDHPDTTRFLDFNSPICVILAGMVHFIMDPDDPQGIIDRIMWQVPVGSHLVINHLSSDGLDPEVGERVRALFREMNVPVDFRTIRDIENLFGNLEMLEPGVVDVEAWRPEKPVGERHPMPTKGGVGRKVR